MKVEPPTDNRLNEQASRSDEFAKAIGKIASGVFVITLNHSDGTDGMLATWIGQAAFEPPLVSIAIKKGRPFLEKLSIDVHFVINVLARESHDIFKRFARPKPSIESGLPDERFSGLSLLADCRYGPVFVESAAYLCCQVKKMVEAGDHYLILAQVIDGALLDEQAQPMVHLRNNGFQY